ncbi:MAG: TIGR03915 family putative DNA repair protein [Oscillospiraceae bacterium]|jgi:probable DNA metabolism protein|nr:TIGR03915 family putative DNA repair protein [Oscillospiraceae bacterium]
MSDRSNIAYCYDGTFYGLLTCIFDAYALQESPVLIFPSGEDQATLFPVREILTDRAKSDRVQRGLTKIGTLDFVQRAFLTCLPDKEIRILDFVRLAFKVGVKSLSMLADDRVAPLNAALVHLGKESDHYKGFVRFVEVNGVLTSTIEPKNFVLPLLAPHFANRFPMENLAIFDKTHGVAVLSELGRYKFAYADSIEFDAPSERERDFQALWKLFYDTLAIPERYNPRCRMSLMPKRYWSQMSELAGEM